MNELSGSALVESHGRSGATPPQFSLHRRGEVFPGTVTHRATRPWLSLSRWHPRNEATEVPRTADEASACVLAHWNQLDALCRRRFPGSENLAHESLLYVLDCLQADEWARIRSWEGLGRFVTFLSTVASRLLTDFSRMKYGHVRAPAWLSEKSDAAWHAAYRLLIVERYERTEVVEILLTSDPSRERAFLDEVVRTVAGRCRPRPHYSDTETSVDECDHQPAAPSSLDSALNPDRDEMVEALLRCVDGRAHRNASDEPRVDELVGRLRPHVALSAEDCLMLRMRHVEGLKMGEIVKALGLSGDPYKRYHRILRSLQQAFEAAGVPLG